MLSRLRALMHMTQEQFAEYFNIPISTVKNWESGTEAFPKYLGDLMLFKFTSSCGVVNLITTVDMEADDIVIPAGTLGKVIDIQIDDSEVSFHLDFVEYGTCEWYSTNEVESQR